MSGLLQISDAHFGTERPQVVAALERLTAQIAPELVVLSGDITQRATRAQFAAARAFVDRLQVPQVLAIPGNHDIPLFHLGARLLSPYGRYRRAFGSEQDPHFTSPDWMVLMLNTTRWYRHSDGEVSEAQIERTAARLAEATPRQVRIVITHQPVMVTRTDDLTNRLHGRDRAVARWSDAGADLILGGHIHLPFVRPLNEAFADCPPTRWAVQAGTAVSSRVRSGKPNSVNVVHPQMQGARRACRVERWDYSSDEDAFVCAESMPLPLSGGLLIS